MFLQSTLFSCRTSRRFKSFLPSTIALFNFLPSSVVSCSSKSGITRGLDRPAFLVWQVLVCFVLTVFSFFLSLFFSFCFFASFFFSFLFFCTLFISALFLFSLPRNTFTLVLYHLAITVKHIKRTNFETWTQKFVLLVFFFRKNVIELLPKSVVFQNIGGLEWLICT